MDKLNILLESLAAKFGTTVEHLWDVMLHQASIEAFTSFLFLVIIIIATVLGVSIIKAKITVPEETAKDKYPRAEWEDEGAVFACLIGGFVTLVLTLIGLSLLKNILTALLNPEYWVLSKLLLK